MPSVIQHFPIKTNIFPLRRFWWERLYSSFITQYQRYYKDKLCEDHRLVVTVSFAFCVITFEPIEIQTRSAPQNDRLNLSFVKNIYVDGGNLAWNGRKTAISQSTYLWDTLYDHSWPFFCHMCMYLSQNWGSDGHFEVPNGSKSWLGQKLWPQM